LSNAEGDQGAGSFQYNSTGFTMADYITGSVGSTIIYIAIRRGPMKPPTVGTSVFSPNAVNTDASPVTTNFPVDLIIESPRTGSANIFDQDRLRGVNKVLYTYNTDAESTAGGSDTTFQSNTSVTPNIYGSGTSLILWNFRRAPSFFDEVCYTGNSTAGRAITHNLGVTPEMFIVKNRSDAFGWNVYHSGIAIDPETDYVQLNTNAAASDDSGRWNDTAPTSSVFTVGTGLNVNASGSTYVAYLFATCANVSKVGSYTGTGALLTVNCGFTSGARFVLIKRADSTGGWFTYDSARGITSGDDPYLLLNSTDAEVTNTNYVDTDTTGFKVTAAAPAALNANGGTFIFLAIA
jgi:hypothetical protein